MENTRELDLMDDIKESLTAKEKFTARFELVVWCQKKPSSQVLPARMAPILLNLCSIKIMKYMVLFVGLLLSIRKE